MRLKYIKYNDSAFYINEGVKITFGFTESGSNVEDVAGYLNARKIVRLKQIHGNEIYFSHDMEETSEGDGIILDEIGVLAVIKTADCVPLYFRNRSSTLAGIIHVGWRGLYSKITDNLIKNLEKSGVEPKDLFFFSGPAIEQKCYTVQRDLVDKFISSGFSDTIFEKNNDGFTMNVIGGIDINLMKLGVPKDNIVHSRICTFCNKNFPSYRRGDIDMRILNFTLIR